MEALPEAAGYGKGDTLLLFGELFGRGYANGLVDEAKRIGMTVIGTTVGRRDQDGDLRPLAADELAEAEAILGGRIINIPLEAGFDMESVDGLPSVCEQLKKTRPDDFTAINFEEGFIESARCAGASRFRNNASRVFDEAASMIPPGSNVLFAHTMAGGIPRARVFMPLLNRIFKGTGEKFLPSELFWKSGLGKLCEASFNEVTADTFRYLIEESAGLREKVNSAGGKTACIAYGYHGTAVIIGGRYRWQSYTPYVQGIAKMRLEEIALSSAKNGIQATVFNCPEIQTNSSALFLGVEIPLYRLLEAICREVEAERYSALEKRCLLMLKEGFKTSDLLARTEQFLTDPIVTEMTDFGTWPQHNTLKQAEMMLAASAELMDMHSDQKRLVCAELSRIVFLSTGRLMLHASWKPEAPVLWLNHDIIARLVADRRGSGILNPDRTA